MTARSTFATLPCFALTLAASAILLAGAIDAQAGSRGGGGRGSHSLSSGPSMTTRTVAIVRDHRQPNAVIVRDHRSSDTAVHHPHYGHYRPTGGQSKSQPKSEGRGRGPGR